MTKSTAAWLYLRAGAPTWKVCLNPRRVMISAAPVVSQWNTPWRSAAWLTAMASGEAKDPVVILIPSLVISRSVSLIAALGLVASPCRYSILRPLMPPRSLIMSRAICIASQFSMPFFANGPVSGSSTPIRIGCCARARPPGHAMTPIPIRQKTTRHQKRITLPLFFRQSVAHGRLASVAPCGNEPISRANATSLKQSPRVRASTKLIKLKYRSKCAVIAPATDETES